MLKWLFGLLVVVNLVFFAAMRWGGWLTTEQENPSVKAELNADKIQLLTESVATKAKSVAIPAVNPPKVAPVAEVINLTCYQWGPFVGDEIERAQKTLVAATLPNKISQREVVRINGYWVYIGPLKSREMVKLNSLQLKSLGITDYYVLSEEGPWQNTISLGVYKTEVAAKSYLARLNLKGVQNALFGVRERKENEAIFALGPLAPIISTKLEALHKNYPESQLQEISCSAK
jgi:hypothetical protein